MKKKFKSACLFVLSQLVFIGSLHAQWNASTNPVFLTNSAANVGIGTSAPGNKLHIKSTSTNDGLKIDQFDAGLTAASLYLNANSGRNWGIFSTGANNSQGGGHFIIRDIGAFADRFFISGTTGNVGIGSVTPVHLLDVAGDGHFSSKLFVDDDGHFFKKLYAEDQVNVNFGGSPGPARVSAITKPGKCFYGWSLDDYNECAYFESGTIGAIGIAGPHATGHQQQAIGLWGVAWNFGIDHYFRTVGVHGDAYAQTPLGFNAGVYGSGYSFGKYCNTYGVFGDIDDTTCGWAGYFNGNVYCSLSYQSSDSKLKKDIEPFTGSLEKIMQLKPSVYRFRTNEYGNMNLPAGIHYGLIAQELEKVFPEMVKEAHYPGKYDDKEKKQISEPVDFKCVNYTELIPVLISGMQEQQGKIEALENKIAEMEKLIAEMKNGVDRSQKSNSKSNSINPTKGILLQNVPNPFDKSTRIDFILPDNFTSSYIAVIDMAGNEMSRTTILQKGNGSISVSSENLKPGNYLYALFVNGQKTDQKQFVVVK